VEGARCADGRRRGRDGRVRPAAWAMRPGRGAVRGLEEAGPAASRCPCPVGDKNGRASPVRAKTKKQGRRAARRRPRLRPPPGERVRPSVAFVLAVAFGFAVEAAGIGIGLPGRARLARFLLVARLGLAIAGTVVGLAWILRHGHFPSSNTTSRLAESVVSPGDTGADSMRASIAMVFIIGIGGWKPPPSLMLTILRTRRPSDCAYISARACACLSAAWRASS